MGNRDVTTHKFSAVLNKKADVGLVMNALGHMSLSIMSNASPQESEEMGIMDFPDADGGEHFGSKNSFVILKAKNSNKIRTLCSAAKETGVKCTSFTKGMTVDSFTDQFEDQKKNPEAELEYLGAILFGENEKVESLTKKFSLWM